MSGSEPKDLPEVIVVIYAIQLKYTQKEMYITQANMANKAIGAIM